MPKTVLREFTGGLSDEIDAQNLRDDQGQEALDINLKGFALEPGEGTSPISDGGHYFYRGEWIRDSKAVSFEESGIGVIKTFDDKRPEFEEIIKDDANVSRPLGPPLPPGSEISGTIVSEGTRGERPAEGSHLLKLPETVLGVDDTTQSLETYEADTTTDVDHIHYYGGQAYWLVKTSSTVWNVKTREFSGGIFTGTDVTSANLTYFSKGSFFKEGHFVCWDDSKIQSVALSSATSPGMPVITKDTILGSDGGDAGTKFNTSFTSGATGTGTSGKVTLGITGVDINNGVISFTQKMKTPNTTPTAYSGNTDVRWLRMPSGINGCFVVLLRDGMADSDSEAHAGGGNYTEGDPPEVWTDKNEDIFPGWVQPKGKFTDFSLLKDTRNRDDFELQRIEDEAREKRNLDKLEEFDYGFKYAVIFAENDTWVKVKYTGTVAKCPEILVIPNAWADKSFKTGELAAKDVNDYTKNVTRKLTSIHQTTDVNSAYTYWVTYWKDTIDVELNFPSVSSDAKLHWRYDAPIGNVGRNADGQPAFNPKTEYSSYQRMYNLHPSTFPERDPRVWYWDIIGSKVSFTGNHTINTSKTGSWTRYIGATSSNSKKSWLKPESTSNFKNIITGPAVPGLMNRLLSFTPGGAVSQQKDFSVSELWTTATFSSDDNSLTFAQANDYNFRIGDWIKIGQNNSNPTVHLNLRGNETFITAKIIGIGTNKLLLSPPEKDHLGTGKYLDEDCYPVISGFIDYNEVTKSTIDSEGPTCSLIKSDLSQHVLVGHAKGRTFAGESGEFIEVRASGAGELTGSSVNNFTHKIDWSSGQDIRAINEASGNNPKVFSIKDNNLFSHYHADTASSSVKLSSNGSYSVNKNYVTLVDNGGVTVYSTDLNNIIFVKGNPELANGLGLTGNVTEAETFVDSANRAYVCAKIDESWKFVKTSSTKPESSLLTYNFKKVLGFDGTKIWGLSGETSGWDVKYATPFYESNIEGSWVFYASDYTTLTPSTSAWGQIVKSRIGEKGDLGTPRYLSIDWKMDSGNWFVTGTPTIGLNHETGKMTGIKTFKWYPFDAPQTLASSGTATVISDIAGNPYLPLASVELPFDSNITRDIVFFKQSETLLPASGETGGESKITFSNYAVASQEFYVLTAQAFIIVTDKGKEPEWAYRLGQANVSGDAFDASRVGISTFQIGAPNMYNPYGANIDFYYRASFINKWGHESTPSPLPAKGITPLDSADDCIQVSFNLPFFRFDDPDIEKIRLYRYGGDSSEFLHLSDIEMPTLPVDSNGKKYFPTISGISSITNGFTRKSASSPYYLLKTYKDLTSLAGFVNSNFLLTATPSTMDGSWRVNQISEVESPGTTHTSKLAKDIDITDTTVELVNSTGWPSSGVMKIDNEYISYSGKTGNSLTGVAHGIHGETPSLHKSGYVKTVSLTSAGAQWGQSSSGTGADKYKTNDCPITFQNIDGHLCLFADSSAETWEFFSTGSFGYAFELKVVGGRLPKGLSQNTVYKTAIKSDTYSTTTGGWFLVPLNCFEESGKVGTTSVRTQIHGGFWGHQDRIPVTDGDLGSGSFFIQANIFSVPQHIRSIYGVQQMGGAAEFLMQSSWVRPYGENFKVNERVRFRIGGLPVSAVTGPTNISGNFQANLTSTSVYGTSSSGSGVFAHFTIASDASSNLTVTLTNGGHSYKVGDTITITDPGNTTNTLMLTVSGVTGTVPTLPTGFAEDTDYWVHSVTAATALNDNNHTGKVQLKATESGSAMSFTGNSPFGSAATFGSTSSTVGHIFLYSATTAETGKDFYGRYTVNGTTGVIENSLKIINPGEGYAEAPSQIVFSQSQDTGGNGTANRGEASCTHVNGVSPSVVEWELEMEHRNQDTTTLEEEIAAPLTGSTNVLKVKDTSVFPAASASGSPGPKKILIGNEVFTYTGKTNTTFTGVTGGADGTTASAHGLGVKVLSYDENYVNATVTNGTIEIEGFGYRDKSRTPISSLYSMQSDNWPPLGLEYNEKLKQFFETESKDDHFRYIKAVGSLYFGALDSDLRFSKYGTPEYWPLDAVVTLDSEIRGIEEFAGEGIVFTTNSVYRVRGTDPKTMVAFRVPDAKGIPAGYEHTISSFNGGLIWLSASDGIIMYSGGRVTYLTRDKHNITQLKKPYSCVSDGVYWLFQEPGSGNGYRLEMATGEMRLARTSIEAYYAYFADALGTGVVVTKDNIVNTDDTTFTVEEIGGSKVKNLKWKSKKLDVGEPAIPKALGSIAIVYEALNSSSASTIVDGIRGQALAAELLGLDPDDLDAGDILAAEEQTSTDLYDIFTKYDQPNQTFLVDTGGDNLTTLQRRTVIMPVGFDTSTVTVGDRVWNELLADNTKVESLTTTTISSVAYPSIVLDKEPLKSGTGTIYWGNLPLVEIYLNEDETASRSFTLPPGDSVEPQSMDLYLEDLKRFRTISVAIEGDVRVQALSLRHYPLQSYQSQSLHHSADVFYKGAIDFRVMLDGELIYRKELDNAGDDFKEERIYLPASSYGQRAHYMNESRSGMIESVKFNGSLAA